MGTRVAASELGLVSGSTASDFEAYARAVYAWAYRLLGRHHDALDVVQDVFIRWDRQCGQSRPDKPMGWLRRVTVNRAIDARRKRGTAIAEVDADDVRAISIEGALTEGDLPLLRSDITEALAALSEMQRSVLVAKVYDERTFAQIAEEAGVSVSSVKTHYLRAVRAVRDRLGPRWGEETES